MSLNLDGVGRSLCKINGGKYNKKTISVFCDGKDDDEIKKPFNSLKLSPDAKFQQIPDKDTERQITYITGASGSGKSTYIKNYCKEYKKIFKKNEIYLFSSLGEDESLDEIQPKRIKIDQSLVDDPL